MIVVFVIWIVDQDINFLVDFAHLLRLDVKLNNYENLVIRLVHLWSGANVVS